MTPEEQTRETNLESREHLPLLFAVGEVVVVLHGDEGGKVVGDSIVYENGLINMMNTGGNEYLTYSAWHGLLERGQV